MAFDPRRGVAAVRQHPPTGSSRRLEGRAHEVARNAAPADGRGHLGVVDAHDLVVQAVLEHATRAVDDRLEAAFGAVRVTFEYGTAGSAEDLFEGQALRLQIRADF